MDAGAGPLGWSGPGVAGRDCGPGQDGDRGRAGVGWGTCVFLHRNVRRNRLECCFGAEYRGKNLVLFTGFSPRGTRYFPRFPGFFPREKSSAITWTAASRSMALPTRNRHPLHQNEFFVSMAKHCNNYNLRPAYPRLHPLPPSRISHTVHFSPFPSLPDAKP